MHTQGNGMISNLIPTCHFCGIDGLVRPSCLHYIEMCRLKCMIEKKKKARAKMHDSLPSRTLEPMTTRNVIEAPKWIRNDEPACYETNKSPIGSTRSNGLSRSLGPHALH